MSPQVATFVALLRRNPFGAFCTVLIIGLAATSWFLWQQIDDLELTRQDRAKEGEAMLELLVSGSTQRQELAVAHEATRRIEDNLVGENLAENLWYFYKFEEQTKSRLPRLNQLNSPTTDTSPLYRRVPYTLGVTGTYEQVASFLLAIESGPRLAKINSFTFSRRGSGPDAIALELALELLGKK